MKLYYIKEDGQTILEIAIVLPVLILIFFGFWQFGRINIIKQRELMAVRHGAWLKAHTNMSHKDIESEMKKFLLQERGERIYATLNRRPSEGGFLNISSYLDGILNKLTGVYEVSMEYKLRTLPALRGALPYSIFIEGNCTMTRNSWVGIRDTIKEIFNVEERNKK